MEGKVEYRIPREGAPIWIDVMAIPKDAPHPDAAHRFIDFLLEPEVIAAVTNYVQYANANADAGAFVEKELIENPGIYPGAAVRERLFVPALRSQ